VAVVTASTVLNKALSHVGVVESPPGSNCQQFGAAYGFNCVAWCDIFVSQVGFEASGSYALLGKFAYTPSHAGWWQSKGRWGTTPRVGAVVFFDWDDVPPSKDDIDHVGLVLAVLPNGLVRTVEGNSGTSAHPQDGVWVHDRNPACIAGYGYPAYGSGPVPPKPPVPPFPGYTRLGSSGTAVRAVQQRLHDRGWAIGVDGIFGPQTDNVVRLFQREKGLGVDGIVGPVTWNALWTAPVT